MEVQVVLITASTSSKLLGRKELAALTQLTRMTRREPHIMEELKILAGEMVLSLRVELRKAQSDIVEHQWTMRAFLTQLRGIWRWMLDHLTREQLEIAAHTIFADLAAWQPELTGLEPEEIIRPPRDGAAT